MALLSERSIVKREATYIPHLQSGCDKINAGGTVRSHRLCSLGTGGTLTESAANDKTVIGVNESEGSIATGKRVPLVTSGATVTLADDALTPSWYFKAGDAGRALRFLDAAASGLTVKTTGNGEAFTNQPANDGIEVVSANAGDTTQTITLIGTTTGTDTVVVETVTLNGTTPVATAKTDWGVLLAWKKSAATLGTVTIREASADQTISTSTASDLSGGVEAVTAADQQTYNVAPTVVASGATTKQIGLGGTNSAGTQIYDSQALNGTTAETMNSAFKRVTEVYTGDLESNRTVTVKTGAAESEERKVGLVLTSATAQNDVVGILL